MFSIEAHRANEKSNCQQVRCAKHLERFWGRRAVAHLCVSHAMQHELAVTWGIQAEVFYDKPPTSFRPTPLQQAHDLWLRLTPVLAVPMHPADFCTLALQPLLELMDARQLSAVADAATSSSAGAPSD